MKMEAKILRFAVEQREFKAGDLAKLSQNER